MYETVEPWLRGTLTDVEPVRRAVLHALQLALEDAETWCAGFSEEQMMARPLGLPSIAFQLRHMARSVDRLLTYAEGSQLTVAQLQALRSEMEGDGTTAQILQEFRRSIDISMNRVHAISVEHFAEPRVVGRKRLPTTVAGLLIHCAEHMQRHVGQMVTTVKVVRAMTLGESS